VIIKINPDYKQISNIEDYLTASPRLFWSSVEKSMNYVPTISGYTTTYNCLKQNYPFVACIRSMLQFCDEVCVVDGGSIDGTLEKLLSLVEFNPEKSKQFLSGELEEISSENKLLKIKSIKRDWSHPRHAVFDGLQKAEARKMCTMDFCWQMDSDEVVHHSHYESIKSFVRGTNRGIEVVCLPVIEFWGSDGKVRIDVTPWKWRLSRNKPTITHGIPGHLRKYDENGDLYAMEGTDGCDMIYTESLKPVPNMNYWNNEFEFLRRDAILGNKESLTKYKNLIDKIIDQLPCVFHYSWYDISRKIRLYRDYWQNHWASLYNINIEDTTDNNMFFDVPWSEVTDEMIEQKSKQLENSTGGWIFHTKWPGVNVPSIHINVDHPEEIIGEL
jgi:glycosyltransferase involved in cell wall biosynthesis